MSVFRYPAGVPTVFTHHEVLRPRPVDWSPGRRGAGRAGPSASSTGAAGRASSARPGGASTASRSSAGATPRRSPSSPRTSPRGCGSTPSAWSCRRAADPAREVPGTILFVGAFAHPPNRDAAIWLAREILPAVLERAPEARLRIVGTAPPPEVLGAGRAAGRGRRRRAQRRAAHRSGGGGDGAGADRRRDADEGAAGDGRRQGGGDDPARDRGLHRLRRGAAAGGRRERRRRSPRRRRRCSRTTPRRRELGERAREFAERHHSPEAWAERQTAVYEEARAARRSGSDG